MEGRGRRADHPLRLPHLPLRRGADHGDRPRPCRPCLQRCRRREGLPRGYDLPLAERRIMSRTVQATAPYAARIFEPGKWTSDQPLRVVLIGTDFQVRVWESAAENPVRQGRHLFRYRQRYRPPDRAARRGCGGRPQTRSPSWCPAIGRSARTARSPAIIGA